ncbi:hypothetical protein GOBAR_DD08524 [Gossypium barbadense]|nr:hypothetical protein GOBAR_DD08524 [Gossypium barbadense]
MYSQPSHHPLSPHPEIFPTATINLPYIHHSTIFCRTTLLPYKHFGSLPQLAPNHSNKVSINDAQKGVHITTISRKWKNFMVQVDGFQPWFYNETARE